jgi:hypothetical protein
MLILLNNLFDTGRSSGAAAAAKLPLAADFAGSFTLH